MEGEGMGGRRGEWIGKDRGGEGGGGGGMGKGEGRKERGRNRERQMGGWVGGRGRGRLLARKKLSESSSESSALSSKHPTQSRGSHGAATVQSWVFSSESSGFKQASGFDCLGWTTTQSAQQHILSGQSRGSHGAVTGQSRVSHGAVTRNSSGVARPLPAPDSAGWAYVPLARCRCSRSTRAGRRRRAHSAAAATPCSTCPRRLPPPPPLSSS